MKRVILRVMMLVAMASAAVQDSREEFTRSLESVFHIPQVHREDMVRK